MTKLVKSSAKDRYCSTSGAIKIKKILEVMMDIMSHTSWGDKIDAATTIVDFIKDVKDGKKIKVADVFDLTCAINCFLPSGKDLGEFAAKSVKKGFSRAKFAKTIKSIDVKSLKNHGHGVDGHPVLSQDVEADSSGSNYVRVIDGSF